MFMSGLSESKQTHVSLRNVDPATLQIIITYAYTGNLAISDSTVEPLYETACFLQVRERAAQSPDFASPRLTPTAAFVPRRWRMSCCSAETTW